MFNDSLLGSCKCLKSVINHKNALKISLILLIFDVIMLSLTVQFVKCVSPDNL